MLSYINDDVTAVTTTTDYYCHIVAKPIILPVECAFSNFFVLNFIICMYVSCLFVLLFMIVIFIKIMMTKITFYASKWNKIEHVWFGIADGEMNEKNMTRNGRPV